MDFKDNGMVYFNQSSIKGQTFHWHDELELLILVEGSLELKVGYEWLRLTAGDIMLINSDEIHSMKETEEKNVVVCVYISCNACHERYPDFYEIVALWPYSEAFNKINQNKMIIMENVNKLAGLMEQTADRERIEQQFDSMLKSIIYCYRLDITDLNGAAFQVTDEKMDVIYRTIKYLYSNYDHKVNLKDVSEQEYLSLFYLSHSFKDITGYCFRDWLNFVRVEKAEKLLLKTSLPITEIAYQCGFSDVRYFNKHFMKWYKISPNKYRKLFRESYEMHASMASFEENVSMTDIIGNIESIAPEIKADTYVGNDIYIDINDTCVIDRLDPSWKEKLWCSGSNMIGYRSMQQIEEVQRDIDFTSIVVDELFSADIQQSEDTVIRDFHDILNYILDRFRKVILLVSCNKDDQYEIDTAEQSMVSFFNIYPKGRAAQLEFRIDMTDNEIETEERIGKFIAVLDSFNISHKKYEQYKKPMDKRGTFNMEYISGMIDGEIRMEWLYYKNGFKDNLYYLYMFVSRMEEAVVAKNESYVVTRKADDLQLLFHNGGTGLKLYGESCYRIALKNLSGDYKIIKLAWDSERDDVSSAIKNPKVIRHLSDQEFRMVDNASVPMVSVDYISEDQLCNGEFDMEVKLAATCIQLILLKKLS